MGSNALHGPGVRRVPASLPTLGAVSPNGVPSQVQSTMGMLRQRLTSVGFAYGIGWQEFELSWRWESYRRKPCNGALLNSLSTKPGEGLTLPFAGGRERGTTSQGGAGVPSVRRDLMCDALPCGGDPADAPPSAA